MNAAVTGGTGFFGGALIRILLQRGCTVRALVRRTGDAERMRAMGVTPVIGDLTDPAGCEGLVGESDVVFHCAARVDMSGRWEKFQRTTIDGTENLLATALPCKPRRFIYISSGGVYGPNRGRTRPLRADLTTARPVSYNYYGRAKLAAEQLVKQRCRRAGCSFTILRMGFLYGERNQALFRHFVPLAQQQRLFIVGDGDNRIATLYIDDAVRATISAAEADAAEDQTYDLCSDECVTQQAFYNATIDALDLPRCRKHANRTMAMLVAWLTDVISHWAGYESHISRAAVALMSADQVVDSSRAKSDLGWQPEVSFQEGIRRLRQWYLTAPGSPGGQTPLA